MREKEALRNENMSLKVTGGVEVDEDEDEKALQHFLGKLRAALHLGCLRYVFDRLEQKQPVQPCGPWQPAAAARSE